MFFREVPKAFAYYEHWMKSFFDDKLVEFLTPYIKSKTLPYSMDFKQAAINGCNLHGSFESALLFYGVLRKNEANIYIEHLIKDSELMHDLLYGGNLAHHSCVEPDSPSTENKNEDLIKRLIAERNKC